MAFTIAVQGLRLPVSIGWTDAERATPQTIRFDVSIELPAVPLPFAAMPWRTRSTTAPSVIGSSSWSASDHSS